MNKPYNPADRFSLRHLLPCSFSRKRGRACEDDNCEFTPISKRINNLHIRSCLLKPDDDGCDEACREHQFQCSQGGCLQPDFPLSDAISNNGMQPDACYINLPMSAIVDPSNNRIPFATENVMQHMATATEGFGYSPELGAAENPHYYQINGLLYGLHLDRLQRSGKAQL